jgi:hypothetical protein
MDACAHKQSSVSFNTTCVHFQILPPPELLLFPKTNADHDDARLAMRMNRVHRFNVPETTPLHGKYSTLNPTTSSLA